jgi:hypothetical protein
LAALSSNSPRLTTVNLSGTRLFQTDVDSLCAALVDNTHVTKIEVADCNLGCHDSLAAVSDIARAVARPGTNVTCFDAADNCLKDTGTETLIRVLVEGKGSSLRNLDISDNDGGFAKGALALQALADAMKPGASLCNLEEIDVSGNGLDAQGLSTLCGVLMDPLQPCKLRSLRARDSAFGSAGATALARALAPSAYAGMSTLDIGENSVGDDGVRALADSIGALAETAAQGGTPRGLTCLNLYACGATDAGAAALAEALVRGGAGRNGQSLSVLHLTGNSVGEAGAMALAGMLSHPSCRVADLHLLFCEIPREGAAAEALRTAAAAAVSARCPNADPSAHVRGSPAASATTLHI